MNEDQILVRIDLERELAKLDPADRSMMRLIYRLEQPEDWTGTWPPTYEEIGVYIGGKFDGVPLSEATIRYRRDVVLQVWAGTRGQLRRKRKGIDL